MRMGHRLQSRVPTFWLAALGLLLPAGCAGDEVPTDLYELSGFVREDLSNDPVAGARVTFTSDTLYQESATTDEDGLYEMVIETDTPFGQVRAEKDAYQPAEQTVYFDTPTRRIDLRVRVATSPPED